MSSPTLSVTITSYNYAQYIGKTIESILSQSFTDFELIIVDDVSPDNSVEVIKSYAARDNRIRLIEHKENKGFVTSIREACSLARGRYLVHVDSDDWILHPQAFEMQLAILEKDPEITFVYSALAEYSGDGRNTLLMCSYPEDMVLPGEEAVKKAMGFYVGHTGPIARMSAYQACGGYDTSYQYAIDLKLWFDLCALGKVGYIKQPLYAYRQHQTSMKSTAKMRLLHEEIIRSIDSVFAGPLGQKIKDPAAVRRHAIRNSLTGMAIPLIFAGQYRDGWRIFWNNIKLRPVDALFQRRTLIMVARTVLGAKGFDMLKKTFTKFKPVKQPDNLEESKVVATL